MMQNAESLGAVYIYIYIVRFNKITLCEHRKKLCFLDICKKSNEHSFLCYFEKNFTLETDQNVKSLSL